MSPEDERQELERVIELLGRSTRPGRLLAYLGARYFQQLEKQLTEFDIATDVFGRSVNSFDPAHDAVVRVEVHRLRKKLRDIYQQSGSIDGVQISLPAGSYVPKFVTAALPAHAGIADARDAEVVQPTLVSTRIPQRLLYGLAVVGTLCAGILGWMMIGDFRDVRSTPAPEDSKVETAAVANGRQVTEVHLMAGHSGSEVIDNSGVRWTPDRFFVGGGPWARDSGFVRGTSRPFLFSHSRSGEFGYDIPLVPGSYEMRLFFVSSHRVGDEKLAGFNVSLNGSPLLTAFDVNINAHGADIADEAVFRDISPGQDGFVRLRFTNQVATPSLNALEIVPGIPHRLQPIRIIMQPTSFVDHKGQHWRADDYYLNGLRSTERHTVSGTDDPELFGGERYGHFSYAVPVDARGRYTVVLHFAELYFGPQLPAGGGINSRVFHVYCNGEALLKDFDIYKEAGSLRVITKTFPHIRPSAQGKINLTFEPVVNNASVSGIEVLDEPSGFDH